MEENVQGGSKSGCPPAIFREFKHMKTNKSCYILISAGYEEKSIIQAIEFFRYHNVEISFLHLCINPLMAPLLDNFGVESRIIGDLQNVPLPDGLLFAGGNKCAEHFLIDPRVYRLVEQMKTAVKPIGYLYPIAPPLVEMFNRSPSVEPPLIQEKQHPERFLMEFLQRMPANVPAFSPQVPALLL